MSEREAGTGEGPADVPDAAAQDAGASEAVEAVEAGDAGESRATAEPQVSAVSWEDFPIPADVLGGAAESDAGKADDGADSGSAGHEATGDRAQSAGHGANGNSAELGGSGDAGPPPEAAEASETAEASEAAEAGGVPETAAPDDAQQSDAQQSDAPDETAAPDESGAQVPTAQVPAAPAAGAGASAAGDGESAEQPLPDLTADDALDAALEALLLVVDVPAGEELLADTLQQPVARIRTALDRMSTTYADGRRGIDLRRVGDGWRFYTRDTYAPYVERYLLDGQRSKLTRAALETLAVIAYRQPVTRSRVAAVRGVNVDGVIRTLLARGLVEEAGADPETGGVLYCTTELFLERLGLSSLKDLPPLAPLLPEVDSIDDV